MTPPFNLDHAPTLDDINALRESVKKDNSAMDRYHQTRSKSIKVLATLSFLLIPIIAMLSLVLDSAVDTSDELHTIFALTIKLMVVFLAFLLISFALTILFKKAPKPMCSHYYLEDDLTATSDEHREQNSNLIINDNLDIQRYVNAVKAQGRPLYKFELKHFSEILTPTL